MSFQTANCLLPALTDALIAFMEKCWGEWEEDRATDVTSTALTNRIKGVAETEYKSMATKRQFS